MFQKYKAARAVIPALLSSLMIAGLANQVIASKGNEKVEAKQSSENCADGLLIEKSNPQTERFGQITMNARDLAIVSEGARIVVKRVPGISEIALSSNCPRNWNISGSTVRQAGFSGEIRKGSSLLADDLGSRAIVNGHVYLFPPGGMKGLKLGADGVFVNGQLVEPLKGSDIPCNCSGGDYLEVHVPADYSGNLKIGATGNSKVDVDSWKGGSIECVMLGNSSFNAGKLESLPKMAFDNKGNGAADISDLDTKIFVANISGQGNGSIRVKRGKAEMSNATVEGNGTIELHGTFKQMQQLVNGTGKIEVKP